MQKKGFVFMALLIIVIFIGIGFYINNVTSPYSGPPVLTVSEEVGDLGKIKPNDKQTYRFILKNEGGEKLVIERVQATCGCTATMLSEEEILSGKTAELEVTFNPRGYKGKVTKSVYIYSNDPKNDRKRIAITADVEHIPAPEIKLSTYQWDLGLLFQGDKSELLLDIYNQGDLDLEIESINIPEHIYYKKSEFEFPIILAPEEEIRIKFTYDSNGHESGIAREYIRLLTNDPRRKNVTLRIEGYIEEEKNEFVIYPPKYIREVKKEEKEIYEIKFSLANNSKEMVQLISVNSVFEHQEPEDQIIEIFPGEEKGIVIYINKEDLAGEDISKILEEYIYLNLALPLNISLESNHN